MREECRGCLSVLSEDGRWRGEADSMCVRASLGLPKVFDEFEGDRPRPGSLDGSGNHMLNRASQPSTFATGPSSALRFCARTHMRYRVFENLDKLNIFYYKCYTTF
jgi:hypothetical protein